MDEQQIKFIFYLNEHKNTEDPFNMLEASRLCHLPDKIDDFIFMTDIFLQYKEFWLSSLNVFENQPRILWSDYC